MKRRRWAASSTSPAAPGSASASPDPGLRQRQGRPDRPDPPAGPRARPLGHHGQQRRAGLRPLQPDHRAPVAGHGRGRPAALIESLALQRLGSPEDIATACCSSPPSRRLGHRPDAQHRRRQDLPVTASIAFLDATSTAIGGARGLLPHPERQHRPGLSQRNHAVRRQNGSRTG